MGLIEYKKKRNFAVTAEPKGGKPLPKLVKGACRFVIQKHDASRLHYDFRLEMDGALKSWAVPKGLPWEKGEKHLAVEVEDHPIEYANFEGIIPQGQYGGGTVMVWDRGNYHVYGEEPVKALREGRLHLVLDGEKAKGEWALIRTRMEGRQAAMAALEKRNEHPADLEKARRSIGQDRAHHGADRGAARCRVAIESRGEGRRTLKSRIKAALKKKTIKVLKARKGARKAQSAAPLPTEKGISEIACGQTALHSADEAKVARDAANCRRLDLRAEVRWHSPDRGQEWREGQLDFPERKRVGHDSRKSPRPSDRCRSRIV